MKRILFIILVCLACFGCGKLSPQGGGQDEKPTLAGTEWSTSNGSETLTFTANTMTHRFHNNRDTGSTRYTLDGLTVTFENYIETVDVGGWRLNKVATIKPDKKSMSIEIWMKGVSDDAQWKYSYTEVYVKK